MIHSKKKKKRENVNLSYSTFTIVLKKFHKYVINSHNYLLKQLKLEYVSSRRIRYYFIILYLLVINITHTTCHEVNLNSLGFSNFV